MATPVNTNIEAGPTFEWIDGEAGTLNEGKSTCALCKDHIWHPRKNRARHLASQAHQRALAALARESEQGRASLEQIGPALISVVRGVKERSASLLQQYGTAESFGPLPAPTTRPEVLLHQPMPTAHNDEPVYQYLGELAGPRLESSILPLPSTQAEILNITTGLAQMLEGEIFIDEESDDGGCEVSDEEPDRAMEHDEDMSEQHPAPEPDKWFPWPDKLTCTLDVLMHLPRSAFSEKQLDLLVWLLRMNGVNNIPSLKSIKRFQSSLQKLCGIGTTKYAGPLGHTYYINNLGDIIGQEMANPVVRCDLHFYPEDVGSRLEQAWHGRRWRHKLDPDLLTPMIRKGFGLAAKDFYIWEPTLLSSGEACVPIRWFIRGTKFYADAYRLVPSSDRSGWIIRDWERLVVSESDLFLSLPDFRASYRWRALPSPDVIQGVEKQPNSALTPWNRPAENRWRVQAKGARGFSFLIWLYCDDTSGNVSKRWNKHNSFLFTAAGLPSNLIQRDFNVHFLSTSNIAPPLEMLDGIVDQIEKLQSEGTWVYDADDSKLALVFPAILAMLGDNPMQSEFACHRGLMAKLFCRICKVKRGKEDGEDYDDESGDEEEVARPDDDASSVGSRAGGKKKRQVIESLEEMRDRVMRFLKVGELRSKNDTVKTLEQIMQLSFRIGGKTAASKEKTKRGVKDSFQDVFLQRLYAAQRGKRGTAAEAALDSAIGKLPEKTESPVWRLSGFDPHSETPIEILHVILLGFVKYFWRDAVARLSANQKTILETRLSSFDVSGLSIPKLSGKTLVQYAGSLTGRDFRAISQVAPFVLADLGLPEDCLASWNALSALIPLVWQPSINDKERYSAELKTAIDHFLISTARWTPRWFNKPKFHLILHLPDHILDFGPAGIFATEAFESFNAIIRSKSVHSNRQAPSRDIARAFAQESRVRHLISGGAFPVDVSEMGSGYRHGEPVLQKRVVGADGREAYVKVVFRTSGKLPLELQHEPIIQSYIGLVQKDLPTHGLTNLNTHIPSRKWEQTISGQAGLPFPYSASEVPSNLLFRTAADITLSTGDKCAEGDWVLASTEQGSWIGQIEEILRVKNSANDTADLADLVALRLPRSVGNSSEYHMPRFKKEENSPLRVFTPAEVTCGVNIQHHCMGNSCDCSATEEVFQERERVRGQTRDKVKHYNVGDIVLNTAQMRNAIHIQQHRQASGTLDREQAVTEGCIKAIQAEGTRRAAAEAVEDSLPADPDGQVTRPPTPSAPLDPRMLRLPRRIQQLQHDEG